MPDESAVDLEPWRIDGPPLGSGGQAVVYRVYKDGDHTRTPYVAKVLRVWEPTSKAATQEEQVGRFKREVLALEGLASTGCPNIVPVIDKDLEPAEGLQPWYVMPFYAGGPMARIDAAKHVIYAEVYKGNVDRVLAISESLAITLSWMHEHEPQYVHRDVHTGNIFFEREGGAPILGDFGLVHVHTQDEVRTGAREPFGPWQWRPPELHPGSADKANPKSDVYLLGGVIYEALSGGTFIEQTQQVGGKFTHEEAAFDLAQFTSDHRIRHVSLLLRNMLGRDPQARITARDVAAACKAIRDLKEGSTSPVRVTPSQALQQAAAKYREEGQAYRADITTQHLYNTCVTVAERIGVYEPSAPYVFHRQVAANRGDAGPNEVVAMRYPGAVWAGVRVLVRFEPNPPIMVLSYVLLIRTDANREIVAIVGDDSKCTLMSESFPDDPKHPTLMLDAAIGELDRLADKATGIMQAIQDRERSDSEFRRMSIPGVSCSYDTARLLRLLIKTVTERVWPWVETEDAMATLSMNAEDLRRSILQGEEALGFIDGMKVMGPTGFARCRIRPEAFVRLAPKIYPDLRLEEDGMTLLRHIAQAGLDGRIAAGDIARKVDLPIPRAAILLEFLEAAQFINSGGSAASADGLLAGWYSILPRGEQIVQGHESLGNWI